MSNSLDPDQARRFVGPDLGPNCLPRLSADDTGRQRVKLQQNKINKDQKGVYLMMKTTVKFLNFRTPKKLCCNLSKIQTKRPNFRVFRQKDLAGIANSEDPDQTAPIGAV